MSEATHYSVRNIKVGWLPQQVSGKQESCRDLAFFQRLNQLVSLERRIRSNRDEKPEPTRIALFCWLRQNEPFLKRFQASSEPLPVVFARFNEAREFSQLGYSHRRLHVG